MDTSDTFLTTLRTRPTPLPWDVIGVMPSGSTPHHRDKQAGIRGVKGMGQMATNSALSSSRTRLQPPSHFQKYDYGPHFPFLLCLSTCCSLWWHFVQDKTGFSAAVWEVPFYPPHDPPLGDASTVPFPHLRGRTIFRSPVCPAPAVLLVPCTRCQPPFPQARYGIELRASRSCPLLA